MIFEALEIDGLWRVRLEPHADERGFFARTFCADEFAAHGLVYAFEQSSLSRNTRAGVVRGMHFQALPDAETKFVRCVRGAVFDVAIDLRPGSLTPGRWHGEVLDARHGAGLYIPAGFAHGFQTLEDDSEVLYQITPRFRPGLGRGVRWNDPAFAIAWPRADAVVSERDAAYPDWRP